MNAAQMLNAERITKSLTSVLTRSQMADWGGLILGQWVKLYSRFYGAKLQ